MPQIIEFAVEQGDATSFAADVLALKHAQFFYGVDAVVAERLQGAGYGLQQLSPGVGSYTYVEARGKIGAPYALFVGVPSIGEFTYLHIRGFAAEVLSILAREAPQTRHIAMTIHGVGFGLDEGEVFLAQLAGCLDALRSGNLPSTLSAISIVERNPSRVQRLRTLLNQNLGQTDSFAQVTTRGTYLLTIGQMAASGPSSSETAIREAGNVEVPKPHIFVAMPYASEFDDVFYYGIKQPINNTGFLCERIDHEAFTGDILERIKKKIETAALVIAELTGSNPNVYLEVGYAWGKGRPTLLLAKNTLELRFDIQGHRCLIYDKIKKLEESLTQELQSLKAQGAI